MGNEDDLKSKIVELERQLNRKEKDLRVYKHELSRANDELEVLIDQVGVQLRQSLKIQKFLVPTEFPNIPGFDFSTKYRASASAGGDYFDIFEHQDKMRFGLFLSSSSGYGMSSLFLSVLMKMTFDIEGQKSRDPAKVLDEIVEKLKENASPKDTSAIFYGVFDRRKFQLTFANLGQGLCIYHQESTDKIQLLQGVPKPFSMESESSHETFENQVLDLQPRDKLIFCSNGFLGLKNESGESMGLQYLLSIVKKNVFEEVHTLRNELLFEAEKFCPELSRDLTVLVVEVKDRIIQLAR